MYEYQCMYEFTETPNEGRNMNICESMSMGVSNWCK